MEDLKFDQWGIFRVLRPVWEIKKKRLVRRKKRLEISGS